VEEEEEEDDDNDDNEEAELVVAVKIIHYMVPPARATPNAVDRLLLRTGCTPPRSRVGGRRGG
jgi:hypothetical protein